MGVRCTRGVEIIRFRRVGDRRPGPAGPAVAGLVVVCIFVLVLVSALPVTAVAAPVGVPATGAGSDGSGSDVSGRVMRSPLAAPVSVVTGFDPPAQRWLPGHRGVDLAGAPGSPVLAPADGTVTFAGAVGGRPVVSVDHGGGLRTTYEPVTAEVRAGEVVAAGARIGRLRAGHPGCPAVACLHWGVRVASGGPSGDDDDYVDPLALLADTHRPIRLKATIPGDGVG